MRFHLIAAAILLSIMFVLTGCTGAREVEEVGYVLAIGIDKADQPGMIKISYQMATPKSGGEGGEGVTKKAGVITVTASSLAEGRNLLSSVIAPMPTLSQIKILVISEEVAQQGVADTIGAAKRFPEYRGSMFIVVAKGKARDFMEMNKPIFEYSPSKYYELAMLSGTESGYYLRTTLHNFYTRMKSNSGQAYAALVGVNSFSGKGKPENAAVKGDRTVEYLAGNIPREGGDPLEFMGTAVFVGDKMVGELANSETRILSILLGQFPHGFITIDDPLFSATGVNVVLRVGSKPKITADLVDGTAIFHLSLLLEGEITAIPSGINYEDQSYLSLLEEQISQVFEERLADFIRHTQQMNSDVAGFGYYLRPCFSSFSDFEDYHWNQKYSQSQFTFDIKTKIRRTGLMLRTYPIE